MYNPLIHHRHSLRKQGYDYSYAGAYFITICSHDSGNVFGNIKNGKMYLNEYGIICNDEWMKTPIIRPNVELVTYVLMPDHFHALFIIKQKNNQRYINNLQNENHIQRGVLQYAPLGVGDAPLHVGDTPSRVGDAHMRADTIPPVSDAVPMGDGVPLMDMDDCAEFTFQSQYAPLTDDDINQIRKMPHSPSQTVGAIVRGFKSCVTKK